MAKDRTADRVAALGLWCVPGVSRASIADLAVDHGSLAAAADAVPDARRLGTQAFEAAEAFGATVLVPGDAAWPVELDQVSGPPGALFVWGTLPPLPGVSIVGSRHATASGLGFARSLARDLAGQGLTVVSGGALGSDGAARAGALERGRTLVVLGSGLGELYPPRHVPLFQRVADSGGAVVTEFPFGTPAFAYHFPRRNRLIAALGRAVVVVEAALRSGSLLTAERALALGRPVLAVPGTPGQAIAEGVNTLLKRSGVRVCTGAEDVLAALGAPRAAAKPPGPRARRRAPRSTGAARLDGVAALLGLSPRPLDELAEAAQLTPAQAASAVSRLELLGLACRAPGGQVYRPREVVTAASEIS